MPKVMLRYSERALRTIGRIEMMRLCQEVVPNTVAAIVMMADELKEAPSVIVIAEKFNELGHNTPDVEVEVQPSDVDESWESKRARREMILEFIGGPIANFMAEMAARSCGLPPGFNWDVDVRPICATGENSVLVDGRPQVLSSWGKS